MRKSVLIVLVLLAGCQESLQSKLQNNLIERKTFDIGTHIINSNQRNLSDVWNKIKSKIVNAWEALKKVADKTKKHVQNYLRKIKEKVEIIGRKFEIKIESLKNHFRKIIEDIIATGENLKICLKNDKEVIENLLKEILFNVTICISNNINSKLKISNDSLDFDDSLFLRSIENKMATSLNICDNNNEQCLENLQEDIFNDIDVARWNVSEKALTVRNTIDDGLETITACITEGLIKASTSIVNESIQIVHCVKDKQ